MKIAIPGSRTWLYLAFSIISAACMWNYVLEVWGAGQSPQFSDLYAPWWAAHELVFHHRDPYTIPMAHEIQLKIYGASVTPSFAGDPSERAGGFAYPIHATFFLFPTVWLDFKTVQVCCGWLLGALTAAGVMLWLHVLRWRPGPVPLVTLIFLILGCFPVLQAIRLGNLSALAAFLIIAAMASLARERFILAGVLLAAATFKPQFVILLIPSLGVWTLGDWRRRRALVWSFCLSLIALAGLGELAVAGWPGKFLTTLRAYRQYTYGHSVLDLWLPGKASLLLTCLVVAWAAGLSYRYRNSSARTQPVVCAWLLATTLLVIPSLSPHAQIILVPGYLSLLRYRQAIWQAGRWARILLVLAWALPLWESWAAIAISIAMLFLPAGQVQRLWLLPLFTSPIMPLGIILGVGYLLMRDLHLHNQIFGGAELPA